MANFQDLQDPPPSTRATMFKQIKDEGLDPKAKRNGNGNGKPRKLGQDPGDPEGESTGDRIRREYQESGGK